MLAGNQNPNSDALINDNLPTDSVQSLAWSPAPAQQNAFGGVPSTPQFLVAGSWDNTVKCWQVEQNGTASFKGQQTHEQPVLSTCWSPDGAKVFSGSCDKTVKCWDLNANQFTQVAQHDAPVKFCQFVPEINMLVTGSWDKTLKYWDTRTPNAQTVQLGERVYAMDIRHPLMVVATADRQIFTFHLSNPMQWFKKEASPLKYQSRSLACFPDASGFALGSVEGRVAIHHVQDKDREKDFAFKCHRTGQNNSEIYSVNAINFHPHGTFATAGADGAYNFWDKDSKQRLKQFARCHNPISCSAFNSTGNIFAYAVCYDWSKGHQFNTTPGSQIMLHSVSENEIMKRNKAGGNTGRKGR